MKNNKIKIILFFLLFFAIFILIGMVLIDMHDAKANRQELSNIVDELDKVIEENLRDKDIEKEITNDANMVLEEGGNKGNTIINEEREHTKTNNSQGMDVTIENYTVFGKIKIEKIGIEYPIIKYVDEDSLWKSICKISTTPINGTGNLCLAGHNMRNLTMFAKIKKLKKGDKIEITNIYGDKYIYEVYESYYVEPDDIEVLKDTEEPIVTLITCNNIGDKRLIVRAKI